MYLFTLAIESHSTDEEKRENISNYIGQLEQKMQNSLLYELTEEEPELSIAILKYCKKQMR